jgi:hypothetical protein
MFRRNEFENALFVLIMATRCIQCTHAAGYQLALNPVLAQNAHSEPQLGKLLKQGAMLRAVRCAVGIASLAVWTIFHIAIADFLEDLQ